MRRVSPRTLHALALRHAGRRFCRLNSLQRAACHQPLWRARREMGFGRPITHASSPAASPPHLQVPRELLAASRPAVPTLIHADDRRDANAPPSRPRSLRSSKRMAKTDLCRNDFIAKYGQTWSMRPNGTRSRHHSQHFPKYGSPRAQLASRLNTRDALVPPKPNELDRASVDLAGLLGTGAPDRCWSAPTDCRD